MTKAPLSICTRREEVHEIYGNTSLPICFIAPKVGSVSKSTLKIISGFGSLNGKTILQEDTITGTALFTVLGQNMKVWVIEGRNTNYLKELGQYEVTYYFNEKYGFVYWEYRKPNGEKVIMTLVDVKGL